MDKNNMIYRQSAIDAVHKSIIDFFDICDDDEESPMTYKDEQLLKLNKAITTQIKAVPSAQQWIPCSERLPAYCEDVILSIGKYCNVGYLVAANDETDEWYYSGWYHPINDVSAWMPLPDPYKGEDNETN